MFVTMGNRFFWMFSKRETFTTALACMEFEEVVKARIRGKVTNDTSRSYYAGGLQHLLLRQLLLGSREYPLVGNIRKKTSHAEKHCSRNRMQVNNNQQQQQQFEYHGIADACC